ncbi:MAG: phosphatase [Firmicutes bacterium]|jgi:putative hydrolase|nr:phosphatase [Bacillota bacterium]
MRIVADLHTHTIASGHAYSTIQENARAGREKGLQAIAVTDHGPSMPHAPEPFYFGNLHTIPDVIEGVRVIKGVEANITGPSGTLDLPERYLERLELVLAGLHAESIRPSSVEENTSAILGAVRHPLVKILVHLGNPQFPLDYEAVVRAAAQFGKVIEINNSSLVRSRQGSKANCLAIARLCRRHGVPVVLSSDAHFSGHVGELDEAVRTAAEAGLEPELIINLSMERVVGILRTSGARVSARDGRVRDCAGSE